MKNHDTSIETYNYIRQHVKLFKHGKDDIIKEQFTEYSIKVLENIVAKWQTIPPTKRKCKICGCTEHHSCSNHCFWLDVDLCSNCTDRYDFFNTIDPIIRPLLPKNFIELIAIANNRVAHTSQTLFIVYSYNHEVLVKEQLDSNDVILVELSFKEAKFNFVF